MVWYSKGLAILIGTVLAILILRWYVLIPIGIIVLLFIIRKLADLFWYGRDKGKW